MRRPILFTFAITFYATFVSQHASAQTASASTSAPAGEPVQLSVFEVTTTRDVGYQSTNAAEVTRMNTPIENIPMNVSIYNQQFIEDLLATDTSQLLAYEAAAVKTNENDNFLMRGFANPGRNFLNGFAQTAGFGSQPLANIERVEVIRGPAAVLYGAGGYGGTINRITKQPQARAFATGRVIASNYGSFRNEIDLNAPLPVLGGKKFMFRLNGIYDRGYNWFHTRIEEEGLAPARGRSRQPPRAANRTGDRCPPPGDSTRLSPTDSVRKRAASIITSRSTSRTCSTGPIFTTSPPATAPRLTRAACGGWRRG